MTQTDIALYLRGKEGNRTSYVEERTEDLEKYGILVVGQDQDRPGIRFYELLFSFLVSKIKFVGFAANIWGGGYDYKQSFSGRVSQLVMMSRALEADEVAQVVLLRGP